MCWLQKHIKKCFWEIIKQTWIRKYHIQRICNRSERRTVYADRRTGKSCRCLCSNQENTLTIWSTEPSLFCGDLGEGIKSVFQQIGKRFTFGGEAPKDQRVYFVNTKELVGNKYGTPNPVPFRVVDNNIGLDIDISIKCFGEYSYANCQSDSFYIKCMW